MGMDPLTLGMIGMLGSSALGGITAPEGQKMKSFDRTRGLDPTTMLGEGKGMFGDVMGSAIDNANQDITLRTTVNPLPSFVGGALPMAISAPGMDANRLNPALRTTPGMGIPKRRLTPGPGMTAPGTPGRVDTGRTAVPRSRAAMPANSAPGKNFDGVGLDQALEAANVGANLRFGRQ